MISQSAVEMSATPARWRRPFERWLDGVEAGWGIPLLLVAFVALWMAYLSLAYGGADLHPDTLEAWTVGREFAWGNPKHPPLMGWIASGWTALFPLTDWSFYLLAMVNSAIALYAVDLISRRFVRGDARAVIILLLLLMPAYNFHAWRFNANAVLLSTWPLATYFFLRSFETRSIGWASAAGAAAALAVLGKYYSAFLIVGFAFAAIIHPQRRAYFSSAAPWVSMLAGAAVLAPHVWWLATTGAAPFEYAMAIHAGSARLTSIWDALIYILGNAAYLALPLGVWLVMIRGHLRAFFLGFRGLDSGLKLLALLFAATVLLPPLVTIAIRSNLPPLWNLQALFLAIIVVVGSARFRLLRFDSVNLSAGVPAFLVVLVLSAPFYALYRNTHPFDLNRNFLSLAAHELTRRWHQETDAPFIAISGSDNLAFATAFYSPDHPLYRRPFQFQRTWGLPRPVTLDKGWAAMCFVDDAACMNWMKRVADIPATVIRSEFTVQATLWGRPGVTTTISAMIVPPRGSPSEPASIRVDEAIEDFGASRRLRDR